MKTYGISLIRDETTFTIEADFFVIENGFVQFFRLNELGAHEVFSAYRCADVYHVVEQKKYTEPEILEQIKIAEFHELMTKAHQSIARDNRGY